VLLLWNNYFDQNMHKHASFLLKNCKNYSAGISAPRPPYLRRMGALPPNSQPLVTGGIVLRPPMASAAEGFPQWEILATPMVIVCALMMQTVVWKSGLKLKTVVGWQLSTLLKLHLSICEIWWKVFQLFRSLITFSPKSFVHR